MVNADEINASLDRHAEWLLVRDAYPSFPLERVEISIEEEGRKTFFGYVDDTGFHSRRITASAILDGEIQLDLVASFGRQKESVRLVSRVDASELAAAVEIARLKTANEIASLIEASFPGSRLKRVALNADNGRIAQIEFASEDRELIAAAADVTAKVPPETLLTGGMAWLEKLSGRRRNAVSDLWIIAERPRARLLQKLHALLSKRWQSKITIVSIDRSLDEPRLLRLPPRRMADLWREKPRKISLPARVELSRTARAIIAASPGKIDYVVSNQGETLRFLGLPIARVRRVSGNESAWFGLGRRRQIYSPVNTDEFAAMICELEANRRSDAPNKRHELYRSSAEAWLEAILKRNIKALDSNLMLAPIYNQFRSANDKIDLLALRRDGRLVIIELKTKPNREAIFQAADYWRKIELQRRRGILAEADLFEGREIIDKSVLVYLVAPAWSFHREFEFFARSLSPEIELWRWELHERWREDVDVLARIDYSDFTKR